MEQNKHIDEGQSWVLVPVFEQDTQLANIAATIAQQLRLKYKSIQDLYEERKNSVQKNIILISNKSHASIVTLLSQINIFGNPTTIVLQTDIARYLWQRNVDPNEAKNFNCIEIPDSLTPEKITEFHMKITDCIKKIINPHKDQSPSQ